MQTKRGRSNRSDTDGRRALKSMKISESREAGGRALKPSSDGSHRPGTVYRTNPCRSGVSYRVVTASAGYNLHVLMYTSGNEEALRSPVCVAGRVDQTPDSPRTRSHSVRTRDYSAAESVDLCAVRVSIHLYVGNPTA